MLLAAGINVAARSVFRALWGWKRYPGSVEAICRAVIADCWAEAVPVSNASKAMVPIRWSMVDLRKKCGFVLMRAKRRRVRPPEHDPAGHGLHRFDVNLPRALVVPGINEFDLDWF